jgi:serine/threonine protein phosphatase 1
LSYWALVTLVLSAAGMNIHRWRTDVLTRPYGFSNRDHQRTLPDKRTNGADPGNCRIICNTVNLAPSPHTSLQTRPNAVWNPRSSQNERAAARLPDGLRIYAVGDIHGRADLLESLLLQIDVDCKLYPSRRPIVVFVGDYIDRGPASRQVLDLLLGRERAKETIFLRGNHETFVHRFLSEPAVLDEWRLCGGLETLVSYGLKPSINPDAFERARLAKELAKSIPKRHLEFLESLNLSFNCGDFLFVHAGIRPGVPIRKQNEEDLLWIREEFLSCEQRFEKFVVHGHTPVGTIDIRSNRINIDTGAFATGRLTCIVIEGTSIVELIDVRDWIRNAASIRVAQNAQTRIEPAALGYLNRSGASNKRVPDLFRIDNDS